MGRGIEVTFVITVSHNCPRLLRPIRLIRRRPERLFRPRKIGVGTAAQIVLLSEIRLLPPVEVGGKLGYAITLRKSAPASVFSPFFYLKSRLHQLQLQ